MKWLDLITYLVLSLNFSGIIVLSILLAVFKGEPKKLNFATNLSYGAVGLNFLTMSIVFMVIGVALLLRLIRYFPSFYY